LGDETMPPIIGTAMRSLTSELVPLLHSIGSSPAMMANTVFVFGGPHALDRSFHDRRAQIGPHDHSSFPGHQLAPLPKRVVEMNQHRCRAHCAGGYPGRVRVKLWSKRGAAS